jgi:hypothetical protein
MNYLMTHLLTDQWQVVTFKKIETATSKYGGFYWAIIEIPWYHDKDQRRIPISPSAYDCPSLYGQTKWKELEPDSKIALRKVGKGYNARTEWIPVDKVSPNILVIEHISSPTK